MVRPFVQIETYRTVTKTVVDSTIEGYDVANSCYFTGGQSGDVGQGRSTVAPAKDDDCE